MVRRVAAVLLVFCLVSGAMVFASENNQESWWENQPITGFEYRGLQNVTESQIDAITASYLNTVFTNANFGLLQGELYNTDYFWYFTAEAVHPQSEEGVIIRFTFSELPQIGEVVFSGNSGIKTRDLEAVVSFSTGTFIAPEQAVLPAQTAVTNLYREKGYATATVEGATILDEATNKLTIQFVIVEGRQSKVGQIVFRGNEFVSSGTLGKQIESKAQSLFNAGNYFDDVAQLDVNRIAQYYSTQGYIDAQVSLEVENITQDTDKTDKYRLIFTIEEGAQWHLGSISVTGNTIFTEEDFAAVMRLKPGAILDLSAVSTDLSAILDLYWDEGYIFNSSNLSEERNEDDYTVDYVVSIVEQAQAVVEAVVIVQEDGARTKPYVFERELTIQAGEVFSKAKMIQSARNLYNTGLLTDVQYDITYGSEDGKVVLTYMVEEGNQMDIQFGLTFGGAVGGFPISGMLQWADRNLAGTARDLSIGANVSPDTQSISFSLGNGWVGDQRWSNSVSLSFERTVRTGILQRGAGSDYSGQADEAFPLGYDSYQAYKAANFASPGSQYLMDYDQYRISIGYSTGYTFQFIAGNLSLGAGLSIGLNRAVFDDGYDPFEHLIYLYGQRMQFSNKLTLSFTWDGRDYVSNTTSGYVIGQQITYAGGFMFGLSNYIKSTTTAAGYLTLFTIPTEKRDINGVLSLNTTLSFMLPQYYKKHGDSTWGWHPASDGATRYEMLYLDGMTMARGFNAIFDKSFLWDTMLEFAIPVVQDLLWAEAFTSASAVTKDLKDLEKFSNISWYFSTGVGVKLKIPGFPLGLYLVKNYKVVDGTFSWEPGSIFKGDSENGGLKLVLAITSSLF